MCSRRPRGTKQHQHSSIDAHTCEGFKVDNLRQQHVIAFNIQHQCKPADTGLGLFGRFAYTGEEPTNLADIVHKLLTHLS